MTNLEAKAWKRCSEAETHGGQGFSEPRPPCASAFLRLLWAAQFLLLLLLPLRSSADEFDSLRLKWRDMLTFGTNASLSDSNYSPWISFVGSTAQGYWNSMKTNASRTFLWSDLNHLSDPSLDSSDITGTYARLKAMAMGYAVHGSSLETNAALLVAITGGLDWMYTNIYNERVTNESNIAPKNWYDWEIAAPLNLNDTVVLLYDTLSPSQIANYMATVDHFTNTTFSPNTLTGANKVWKASILALSGAVIKNSSKFNVATQYLSDVFPYVTTDDGFYRDGSFVFHSIFAYNGGYGAQLLDTIGPLMQLLSNSSWQITDPLQTNVYRWVYDSFQPIIYRGAIMQMTDGRYYSRKGDDHLEGHGAIASILRIAQFAPASDAAAFKAMVKYWLLSDTSRNFILTQRPPYNIWALNILNDPSVIPAGELVRHYQFPGMDQIAHLRPGWGLGLAMSSSRSGTFESIQGENLKGWFTGDGMTYLYNADLDHFADNFWSTVDPYRLPGTTVDAHGRTNAPGFGQGYRSPNNWVGGASLQNLYGVAGMLLHPTNSTLTARKSWFMFDNEVVCLGAGITNTDNRPIETIIDNRRIAVYGDNPLTVNGAAKPALVGWSETMSNTSWAHLEGNVPGSDIGYFFPQPAMVKAIREARSGAFSDINTPYGSTNRFTRNYLTLWFDHGLNPVNASYAYVLLPNQTAAQVANYAASPDVVVLANSSLVQGVKESTLGITAVNFWSPGTLAGITVDKKASVIFRDDGNFLEVGLSDPTQTNAGVINLELTNSTAASVVFADAGVTVVQTAPTIKLTINVAGAGGQTFHARFFGQTMALLPVADSYVENGANADCNCGFGTNTRLIVKTDSNTNLTREAFLRFQLPTLANRLISATLRLAPVNFAASPLTNALAPVPDNSWTETGITWNNKPISGGIFTNWQAPMTNTPVVRDITPLARQAMLGDGKLSLRIFSPATNAAFVSYASRDNTTLTNQPQLILNLGQVPPSITLSSPANGMALDAPASVNLTAAAQDADGSVTNIDFYSSAATIGRVAGSSYTLALSNLGPGQYTFRAVATDNTGLMATSAPVSFAVDLPQPVGNGTGLIGNYYNTVGLVGLVAQRTDPTVNFFWSGSPAPSVPADGFSVRWLGKLQTRHSGTHVFSVVSDEGARLWVNGQLIIDRWDAHSTNEDSGTISLLAGQYYDITLEHYDVTRGAVAQLYWTQPGGVKEIIPQTQLYPAAGGLFGSYSTGTNPSPANYVFTRVDDTINFSWGNSTPDPGLLVGNFSAHWNGRVLAKQGGNYTFYVYSVGGARLRLNSTNLIDDWIEHPATQDSATATLAAGQSYPITLDYFNSLGAPALALMWAPPGEPIQLIPAANLTPLQNNSPPSLNVIPNTAVLRGQLLSFTATASDPDALTQSLTFSLDPGAPSGASINPASGLFTWTPSPTQALGNYTVTVRVTDNGVPVMTDAQSFTISVSTNNTATTVTFLSLGSAWRYLDAGTDQGVAWRNNGFSDSSWSSGAAPLGYGSGLETTITGYGPNSNNKYSTTYFRHSIYIPDVTQVQSLTGRLLRNDGVVVYVNGAEVWRDNLPAGPVAYGTLASSELAGFSSNFVTTALSPSCLVSGTNVIAAEVHQASSNGPDILFDLELSGLAIVPTQAALRFTPSIPGPVLSWPLEAGLFQLYTTTNLSSPAQWLLLTNTPTISNGQWVLPLPPPGNRAQFYRLQTR